MRRDILPLRFELASLDSLRLVSGLPTRNKVRGLFFYGFIAFVPSRSSLGFSQRVDGVESEKVDEIIAKRYRKPLDGIQLVRIQPGQSRSGQAGSEPCLSWGDLWGLKRRQQESGP